MSEIDRPLAFRAGLIQLAGVAALSIALPHSFFEDWGWLSGPSGWVVCSLVTAAALRLPLGLTMLGAIGAGLPSLLAVLVGLHWLGALLAIVLFALWCGRLEPRRDVPAPA